MCVEEREGDRVCAACRELDESSAMCINHKNYILVNCKMPTSTRGRERNRGRQQREREVVSESWTEDAGECTRLLHS